MLEWEWYSDLPVRTLFVHLLLAVNSDDEKWKGEVIPRGSMVTSIASLSEAVGLTVKQTRRALEKLKSTNDIETKWANKYSIVSVCNYDRYQSENLTEGRQRAGKGQAEGKQRATLLDYKTREIYKENILSEDNIQKKVEEVSQVAKKVVCKKVEYEKLVRLTEDEHSKLEERYGPDAEEIIKFLSLYKQEKNYTTKSDYLTILRWVADAYYEKQNKMMRASTYQPPQQVKSKAQENYEERQRANKILEHLHNTGQL